MVHSHLTKCASAHTWLRRSQEASACLADIFIYLHANYCHAPLNLAECVRACVCFFFPLSFFLQKVLADIVIRAKFVSRWHTTDRCKLQTQEPLVCELPRNDRVGLPELPPCVFDKEDAAALGLVIHLWNPLSVNVSRFDWAEAFPLFRSRKKPQSRVHFTACLSLLAVDTMQKCRVPQSGFRVIPRLHSSEGGCPV